MYSYIMIALRLSTLIVNNIITREDTKPGKMDLRVSKDRESAETLGKGVTRRQNGQKRG